MDFIVELVAQLLAELLLDGLANLPRRGTPAGEPPPAAPPGRLLGDSIVTGFVGAVAGLAWGAHVAAIGHPFPTSVWVSLGLGLLATGGALWARRNPRWDDRVASWPRRVRPTAYRLGLFALLNAVLAGAIAVGFMH